MLELHIPGEERWDERTNMFVYDEPVTLRLEYSLLSLSKWESKWHKPYLDENVKKTREETLDFVRCMTLTKGVDPTVYAGGKKRARYQTADLFYAAMASYGIPFECEKWHLNRLLALIRACGEENLPPEKMGRHEQAAHIRALNAQRRAKFHSRGQELLSKVIEIRQKGDFKKSLTFFSHIKSWSVRPILEKYGKLGVERLADATPKATGKTAASWSYEIKMDKSGATLCWKNSNIVDGVPIAVILQYGHGTRNGAYVQGVDYINPALAPIFSALADELWKEVKRL